MGIVVSTLCAEGLAQDRIFSLRLGNLSSPPLMAMVGCWNCLLVCLSVEGGGALLQTHIDPDGKSPSRDLYLQPQI